MSFVRPSGDDLARYSRFNVSETERAGSSLNKFCIGPTRKREASYQTTNKRYHFLLYIFIGWSTATPPWLPGNIEKADDER